ncbi:sensor histidine kinase [Leptospira inadai]|uniref:sensor histidine kinase n=1 Tax=Leptospira inadai TaxID=29506 RepID=UPI00028A15C8|nr:sensor histidine kinase [Leptospira inadai]
MHRIFIFFLLIAICVGCKTHPSSSEKSNEVKIESGTLDLRVRNLESSPLLLNGSWEFYWNQFVPAFSQNRSPVDYFPMPGFWNEKSVAQQALNSQGYASYRLKILLPEERSLYAVSIIDLESAYILFVNGDVVGKNGTVGTSREKEIPEWRPAVYPFEASGDTELLLHVSNFHHQLGGIWQGISFGKAESLLSDQRNSIALELFVAGSIFMIGVYHCLIFFVRRRELTFLQLGLFCFIMSVRSLVTGQRYILQILPDLSWESLVRLDYLSVYVGAPVLHWYLFTLFKKYYNRYVFGVFASVSGFFSALVLFLDPLIFTRFATIYHLVLLSCSIYFLYINFIAVLRKETGAAVLWIGWIASTLSNVNDILYTSSIIHSGYFFAIGLHIFLLTHSYYLAVRYANTFNLSERLGQRMESLLTITRNLNRSNTRETAIWTAFSGILEAFNIRSGYCVFLFQPDSEKFIRLLPEPNSLPEATLSDVNMELSSLSELELLGTRLRLPVLRGNEILCVLQCEGIKIEDLEREKLYITGVCESLSVVLDNIDKIRAEALASIGQAASEIVHDINHHCQVIGIQVRTALQEPQSAGGILEQIEREALYMRNMALDILDFARERIIVRLETHTLSEIAKRIETDLSDQLKEIPIEYKVVLREEGLVRMDMDRFRRVVLNLTRNAAAAMQSGGFFQVIIDREDNRLYFIFQDNGPGIKPELRGKLFQPFGLIGGDQKGSGLGLAVVRRIVLAHGGEIHFYSELGKGSRFTIELPANV